MVIARMHPIMTSENGITAAEQFHCTIQPKLICFGSMMVDSNRACSGNDANVLKHIAHFRCCLGYPIELAALATKKLQPVKNPVVVSSSLNTGTASSKPRRTTLTLPPGLIPGTPRPSSWPARGCVETIPWLDLVAREAACFCQSGGPHP